MVMLSLRVNSMEKPDVRVSLFSVNAEVESCTISTSSDGAAESRVSRKSPVVGSIADFTAIETSRSTTEHCACESNDRPATQRVQRRAFDSHLSQKAGQGLAAVELTCVNPLSS